MPRRLRFTDDAVSDLASIKTWLMQPGAGIGAHQRLSAIRSDIRRLKHAPCLYPEISYPGVRELPCIGGFRALYQIDPDTGRDATAGDVTILRIYGPGQNRDRR